MTGASALLLSAALLCVPASPAEIDIRRGGTLWARVESDGWIRIDGMLAGRYEADGAVRRGGVIVGHIESNGAVRIDGTLSGWIEADGTLRKGGTIVGRIDDDGTIRRNGSIWGSATGGRSRGDDLKRIAAVLVFFTREFFKPDAHVRGVSRRGPPTCLP